MPVTAAGITAGGNFVSNAGQKKAMKDQAKREDARIAEANRLAGMDYNQQVEFNDMIKGMFGEGGQYASLLTDPIHSSSQSTFNQVTKPTFTKQAQGSMDQMLANAMNEQARGASLPEFVGMKEGIATDYARDLGNLKTALVNKAAVRGGGPQDTELESVLAGRGITADRNAALRNTELTKEGARQQHGNIANMLFSQLAQLGRGSATSGSSSSESQQGQGAAGLMGYLNMIRPPERKTYV